MKNRKYRFVVLSINLLILTNLAFGQESNPEWTIYNTSNSGLPGNYILCMTIDHNGAIWIGGEFGNMTKFDGEAWSVWNVGPGEIISLAVDSRDNLWIADGGLLTTFDGVDFTEFLPDCPEIEPGVPDCPEGEPTRKVSHVAVDKHDNVWTGSFQGLSRFDGLTWTQYDTSNSGLPYAHVFAIAVDRHGIVWAAGRNRDNIQGSRGLIRFDGKRWTDFGDYFPIWSQSIVIDSQGYKWIGTENALVKFIEIFSQPIFQAFSPPGSSLYFFGAIAIDSNDKKWVGFDGGLARFDGQNWQIWTAENSPLPQNWRNDPVWVTAIAIDKYDNKWLGTYGGGLAVFNENGIVTHIADSNVDTGPDDFRLEQNYPNPFNPETKISYQLSKSADVVIKIFNANGQHIRTVVEESTQPQGSYSVIWDGQNEAGKEAASGLYFIRLQARRYVRSIKAILIR